MTGNMAPSGPSNIDTLNNTLPFICLDLFEGNHRVWTLLWTNRVSHPNTKDMWPATPIMYLHETITVQRRS